MGMSPKSTDCESDTITTTPLYKYFSCEAKHSDMAACLCNKYFLENLVLMVGILQKISLLCNNFQARNLTLTKAERLIKRTIKAFEMPKKAFVFPMIENRCCNCFRFF